MRLFCFLLISLLLVSFVGCFGSEDIKTIPTFTEAKKIAITPFFADKEEAKTLGGRISVNLSTRFELILKDIEWVYDISDKIRPVGEKIDELGITLNDVFDDPALAARVGESLGVDWIVTGRVTKPNLRRYDNDQHHQRLGRQTGISGTSTYITTRQVATSKVRLKIIDVATGSMIYNNEIHSNLKYWFAYQTQMSNMIIFKQPEEMSADIGKHLPWRISYMLYPSGFNKEPQDKVLLKPDFQIKGTGGIVKYD